MSAESWELTLRFSVPVAALERQPEHVRRTLELQASKFIRRGLEAKLADPGLSRYDTKFET